MAQNLFTQSIHQLITDSLLGNPKGGGNLAIVNSNNNHKNLDNQNEQFSNSTTANSSNVSNVYNLKQSLLNLKMPYEIIQAIPLTNVRIYFFFFIATIFSHSSIQRFTEEFLMNGIVS